jgi:hypothetical protein
LLEDARFVGDQFGRVVMGDARRRAGRYLNSVLKRNGLELISSGVVYDWQRSSGPLADAPSSEEAVLPAGAAAYLCPDNPRLVELRKRYKSFDSRVTTPSLWTDDHVRPQDILTFRAENAYVFQGRGPNMHETAYALTEYYVRSIDALGLLDQLSEDELFGVLTYVFDTKVVSRDLLDSILEIYFLERHLGISSREKFNVLDIGAGYGRLAHRMTTAAPGLNYLCTDGIAVSTFICEYYLSFRGLSDRARVIPLDEVEKVLETQPVDLAINVHSFSECTLEAIDWWFSLLERQRVRYVMLVPHGGTYDGQLLSHDRKDFGTIIESHGYRLVAKDPKFGDPIVQHYAITPTYHYLFESQAAP